MSKQPPALIRTIVFLGILLLNTPGLYAQESKLNFNATLNLELENTGHVQGGVVYGGEIVKGIIRFDEEKWDGKSQYYFYVFYYSELEVDLSLVYPSAEMTAGTNKFPQTDTKGERIKQLLLFEGMITPPFGKDNFVLVMTEHPIPDIRSLVRSTSNNRQELLKLIKGSKLSSFYQPAFGIIHVKTMQVESRPAAEKTGLTKGSFNLKSFFAFNDSAELFYTPKPVVDIVRDSFPTLEVLDPAFDSSILRGAKLLSNTSGKKLMIRGIAVDWKRGIKKITVNNQPVTTYREASGYFDHLYDLKDGLNIADVAVENNKGYTRVMRLKFQYQAKNEKTSKEGKDYLFVIGINDYKDWPRLQNAEKDAKDFKKIMADEYGFKKDNIKELFNEEATRKNIHSKLRSYVEDLGENDRLLIYFSGHGFYDKSLDMGYWIPVDAHTGADDEYLNNLDITRMLQKMKAKNIFLIADACYSGQLLRDMQKENSGNYKSRMVLCSGKLQPVPDGQPGTNSPFAKEVLAFLKNSVTQSLLASDLIQHVKRSFAGNDGQKPVGGAIDEVGDENGDFIFERKK